MENKIIQPKDTIIQAPNLIIPKSGVIIRATGLVEMYLTDRLSGEKTKIYEDHNSIRTAMYAALSNALSGGQDNGFTDLFVTCVTQPPNYKDGIVLLWNSYTDPVYGEIEEFYSLKTTLSSPAANQFRMTGLYDAGVAIADVLEVNCGLHWVGTSQGGFFDQLEVSNNFPSGVVPIPISTNYTVVWTITLTVH